MQLSWFHNHVILFGRWHFPMSLSGSIWSFQWHFVAVCHRCTECHRQSDGQPNSRRSCPGQRHCDSGLAKLLVGDIGCIKYGVYRYISPIQHGTPNIHWHNKYIFIATIGVRPDLAYLALYLLTSKDWDNSLMGTCFRAWGIRKNEGHPRTRWQNQNQQKHDGCPWDEEQNA